MKWRRQLRNQTFCFDFPKLIDSGFGFNNLAACTRRFLCLRHVFTNVLHFDHLFKHAQATPLEGTSEKAVTSSDKEDNCFGRFFWDVPTVLYLCQLYNNTVVSYFN